MAGIGKIISVALVCLLVVGCSPPFAWEGHWKGAHKFDLKPGQSKEIAYSLNKIDLQIHPNGKFDLFAGGFPMDGRWVGGPSEATLTVLGVLNQPTDRMGKTPTIRLRKVDPNAIVYEDGISEPVQLTRESQPSP